MRSVIVVNPKSGRGKILKYKKYIIENLSKKYGDITWIETKNAGHATQIAYEYGEKCDYIFVAGGDGTLNEVINGVMKNNTKPTIAQIPCGTVNDFSKSLGIKKNIKKSIRQLMTANVKQIDIFSSNNKYGVYICGLGVFTKTSYTASQSKKNKFGVISYFFNGLKEIKTYKPQDLKLFYDEKFVSIKTALLLAINSKSVGGFKFNKTANLGDGKLDFVAIKAKKSKICLGDLFLIARLFLFGIKNISKNKRVISGKISELKIESESEVLVNFDGELAEKSNKLILKIGESKLNFLSKIK